MTYTQVASIIGAVLAVVVGGVGIWQGWFAAADGYGLILIGLSVLGIHYSPPTA